MDSSRKSMDLLLNWISYIDKNVATTDHVLSQTRYS